MTAPVAIRNRETRSEVVALLEALRRDVDLGVDLGVGVELEVGVSDVAGLDAARYQDQDQGDDHAHGGLLPIG